MQHEYLSRGGAHVTRWRLLVGPQHGCSVPPRPLPLCRVEDARYNANILIRGRVFGNSLRKINRPILPDDAVDHVPSDLIQIVYVTEMLVPPLEHPLLVAPRFLTARLVSTPYNCFLPRPLGLYAHVFSEPAVVLQLCF